jgi:uncharacterized protein YkwD/uncharacterized membrane protein required for colicin V production
LNRSLILDLVVVVTIVLAVVRGWTRRSVREAFALLGIAVGIALVVVATGPLSALIRAVSSADGGLSRAIAVPFLFVVSAVAGTIVGYRITKTTEIPAPPRLDASGGAAFGFVRALLLVTVLLIALDFTWGQQSVGHRMIADSVSGDVLTSDDSPFGGFFNSLVEESDDLTAVAAWAGREDTPSVGYQQTQLEATDAILELRPEAEREMLDAINLDRQNRGLEPLKWCASCAKVARSHSKDMYRGGYFSHEDLQGNDPFDRMRTARISYGAAGENLALAPTVAQAHAGLMASPEHRANILRPVFNEVGIGIYEGPYGLMCTQLFRALP